MFTISPIFRGRVREYLINLRCYILDHDFISLETRRKYSVCPEFPDLFLSKNTIRDIEYRAKELKHFRFICPTFGHGAEGDELLLRISYSNKNELNEIIRKIGVKKADKDRLVLSANNKEMIFGLNIAEKRSGYCEIDGVKLYLGIGNNTISFHMHSNYSVDDATFENAKKIDEKFDIVKEKIIDPPNNHTTGHSHLYGRYNRHSFRRCLCPLYYPQYFK